MHLQELLDSVQTVNVGRLFFIIEAELWRIWIVLLVMKLHKTEIFAEMHQSQMFSPLSSSRSAMFLC